MKRIGFCVAILGMIMVLISGCGGGKAKEESREEPDKKQVQEDVLEYIQELIDEDAEIDYFQQSESEMEDGDYVVTCAVSYSSPTAEYKDEFIITYSLENDGWEVSKCRINEDYDEKSAKPLDGDSELEEKTDSAGGEDTEQKKTEASSASGKTNAEGISDDLSDFTFELEGIIYQLPTPYSELAANGWTLYPGYSNDSEEDEIAANSFGSFYLTNQTVMINVDIINLSGDVRQLKDCTVGSVRIKKSNNLDFQIAKGINCNSTKEDVIAAFGTPSNSNSSSDSESLTYNLNPDSYHESAYFYFDTSNPVNNSIELKCFRQLESDYTEVSSEVPAYLSAYTAPEELEDDITAAVFELDGKLYRLPCTLVEFTEDGWQVSSTSEQSLGARNKVYSCIKIVKGDNTIYLDMENFDSKAALIQNCAVFGLEISSTYLKNVDGGFVKMSGGLNFGSSKEEVEQVCAAFSKYEGSNYVSYTYQDGNNTEQIKYYFNLDPNYPSHSIKIQNQNWEY